MPDPFDGSPILLVLPVPEQGAQANKVEYETEEYIFDQAHDRGSDHILAADMDILRIDPLEKRCHCQNSAVDGKQQIELQHKLCVEHTRQGSQDRNNQAYHLDNRGK